MTKKDTSWNAVATWYDEMVSNDDSYQEKVILPNLIRLMNLSAGQKVLDLACGTGFFALHFAKLVGDQNVTGVDLGKNLIDLAKKNNPKINFKIAPAHNLSILLDQSFDKVALILAIQNIAEINLMLAEIYRVTKSVGSVYIVMNHPAFRIPKRSSWGFDESASVQYRRIDGYLHESKTEIVMNPGATEKKPYSTETTVSFHRPLQYYTKLFAATGFAMSRLEEWISHKHSQAGPRQKEEDRMRSEIPLFLFMEIKKIGN